MPIDLALAAVMVASSMASAGAALLVMNVIAARRPAASVAIWDTEPEAEGDAVFLFDGDLLVDASDAGRALLRTSAVLPPQASDWDRLSACLAPWFPDLGARMSGLAQDGRIELLSDPALKADERPNSATASLLTGSGAHDEALRLVAEWRDGLARIALRYGSAGMAPVMVDRLSLQAATEELALLRAMADSAPGPAWQCDATGSVVWANTAYLALVLDAASESGLTWPLPRLFPEAPAGARARISLPSASETGTAASWFEVTGSAFRGGAVFWATPIDNAVTAENRLSDFRRTLARSFADLPVGLAIFDSRRRLHVFNPALTDLTQLDVAFLSGRPSLEVFLDRLREQQMLPEPRDYSSWRRRLTDLEAAAASGGFRETWSLPGGQTFRVSGHPYPDGTMAFLFEDISADISLQRRFRAEIECSQAALDEMDEAVIVFAPSGHAVLSNAAYARLWDLDPLRFVAEIGLPETIRHWQAATRSGADWARLRSTVGASSGRGGWTSDIQTQDGRSLRMRVTGLPRGATLVGFREIPEIQGRVAPGTEHAPGTESDDAAARTATAEPVSRAPLAPVPAPQAGRRVGQH